MAAKDPQSRNKKRKTIASNEETGRASSKKPKSLHSKPSKIPKEHSEKPVKPSKLKPRKTPFKKFPDAGVKAEPKSKKERRMRAKELAEARKKRRKPHYTLEQGLALLWEKMRCRNISKEERSKLITEALQKMKGKIPEIAGSHVSSRVLQTCVKYCSQPEREVVFEELRPHLLSLARNTYAVHLVKKMLDNASKKQLEMFISSLHGHVASLLRHMVGSVVVEHAFQLGNGSQKQGLLLELYSTELQLFKDLTTTKESKLVDVISKLGLQKASVLQHMTSVIQPILEKGIVDHSIIHCALMEFLTIADKSSATDVLQQLSGPLLVRMIHTREGSKLGILCIKHGGAKERKKIIKGMKGHISKIAHDQYGSLVLVSVLSVVDDTKLITKVIISELQKILKELLLDKNGRHVILQLLHPNSPRYFSPHDLASLDLTVPCLCNKDEESDAVVENETRKLTEPSEIDESSHYDEVDASEEGTKSGGSKKDPSVRRFELLINSGLAETLITTCIENVGELLRSNFGREVIYELATGGSGGIIQQSLTDKLDALHEAIAALAVLPKSEESEEEHLFGNFYSSRTIRKMILDNPTFASKLWKVALEGKCEIWAEGHSRKIVSAFLESSDSGVRKMVSNELQPLLDRGILKIPDTNQTKKDKVSSVANM
ncbi:pumilio homolog 24 [Aristolochia californica]|uniref:pumilio homolog 24 n=1 Tax=Aristolochia californica TaxID=171875 RepID=UPI0035E320D8